MAAPLPGAGLEHDSQTILPHAQYRVALGLELDGYVAESLQDAYRLPSSQFGILAPTVMPVPVVESHQLQGVFGSVQQPVERSNGQLSSRIVVDPPDLDMWRERLFNVDETMVLTHEQ